jgi:protein TonB
VIDHKLAICAVISISAHYALERGLHHLPRRVDKPRPQRISVRVIEPEPPKEPDKPLEPPKPEPKQPLATIPKAQPVHAITVAPVARDAPPPDHPAVETDATSDTQVFGIAMNSTSQQGGAPMTTGNTLAPAAGAGSAAKPLAQPVAAFEATKLPLPQARCFGQYTDEARAAGLEGTVVLDLTVDETGKARDIVIVTGLEHGLSDAAKKALLACRFSPGEKDGKPVPVRIRGFKIQFVLQEGH